MKRIREDIIANPLVNGNSNTSVDWDIASFIKAKGKKHIFESMIDEEDGFTENEVTAQWMVKFANDSTGERTFFVTSLDEIESKIHIGFNTRAIVDYSNLTVIIEG